jgi:hypothetical protein
VDTVLLEATATGDDTKKKTKVTSEVLRCFGNLSYSILRHGDLSGKGGKMHDGLWLEWDGWTVDDTM